MIIDNYYMNLINYILFCNILPASWISQITDLFEIIQAINMWEYLFSMT